MKLYAPDEEEVSKEEYDRIIRMQNESANQITIRDLLS